MREEANVVACPPVVRSPYTGTYTQTHVDVFFGSGRAQEGSKVTARLTEDGDFTGSGTSTKWSVVMALLLMLMAPVLPVLLRDLFPWLQHLLGR